MHVFGSAQLPHGSTIQTWFAGDIAFVKTTSNPQHSNHRVTPCVSVCQIGHHLTHRRLAHVAYWCGEKARCRMVAVSISELWQVRSGPRKTNALALGTPSYRTDISFALATFIVS